MKKAIAISLKRDVKTPSSCVDIAYIYIVNEDNTGKWLAKETVYDLVAGGTKIICSRKDVAHKPDLVCALSVYKEKYVRTEKDDIKSDNLLLLPKY